MGTPVVDHLLTGSLVDAGGTVLDDYLTVRAKEQVVLRDTARSVHRVCDVCGALRYTPWPGENPYVMSWNVRAVAPVYEVEAETLLVREDVLERIGDRFADVLTWKCIPVRTTPEDGLPAELDVRPTRVQLIGYVANPSTRGPSRS
jgi:hypothetical protein